MNYEQSSDNLTELLYDFLDGSLAPEQEPRLFAALMHDTDLRAEFKEQMHINSAIAADEYAFTPPAASGDAIFARLGFGAANDNDVAPAPIFASSGGASSALSSEAAAVPTIASRMGSAFRRSASLVLVALLSSLLTAWLMRSGNSFGNGFGNELRNSFGNDVNMSMGGNNGGAGTPPYQVPPYQPSPWSSAGTSPRPFVIADTVFQTVIKRTIIVERSSGRDTTFLASPTGMTSSAPMAAQNQVQVPFSEATREASITPRMIAARDSTPPTAPPNTPPTLTTHPAPLLGLSIGARGIVSRSIIWATVPSQERFPTNTILSALYALSAQHSIGLEAGQEAFFQRYYFMNPQGVEFRVEQNPTLVWGGLAYRYTMLPESTFSPFAHVVAGATQVGGLGRGMVGVTYSPDTRTQFMLGAEASSLFYQVDGTWFMSPKLGVSYGVSIRF